MNRFPNQEDITSAPQDLTGTIIEASDDLMDHDAFLIYGGQKDQFVGRLEREYGMTKEEAEACVHTLL